MLIPTPRPDTSDPEFRKWWYSISPAMSDCLMEAVSIGWEAGRTHEKAELGVTAAFLRDSVADVRDQMFKDLATMSKELADKLDDSTRAGLKGLVDPPVRERKPETEPSPTPK